MSESTVTLPAFGGLEFRLLWLVMASAAVALVYGGWVSARVLRRSPGPISMQEVASAIQEGARAYLRRQFGTMSLFIIAIAIALYFLYQPIFQTPMLAVGIAAAFLMGCLASYGAGFVGMNLAVRGNVRTAFAATRSFKDAFETAFQAGTVSGMFTVGLGLLGATIIFIVFRGDAARVLIGFGFGGSLVALFMRIGGGIYTKVADVGADLVGKVEVGIPEDDPRNAATIADNVGDNVGDCAGMAADVFESYEVTLVAAIILGAGTLLDPGFLSEYGAAASGFALKLILFPLLVQALGVLASIIGTLSVRAKAGENPMVPITRGLWVSAGAAVVGFALVNAFYLLDPRTGNPDWRFSFALLSGLVLALFIRWLTDQFTSPERRAVTEMAYSTKTGPATFLLSGLGYGLELRGLGDARDRRHHPRVVHDLPGRPRPRGYGVALAGLGLLTVTGYILAMDTFGPIVDNANGIYEMSGIAHDPSMQGGIDAGHVVAQLDQAGKPPKALTKGFAIASAVLAATALFRSFVDQARLDDDRGRSRTRRAAGGTAVAAVVQHVGIQVNLPLDLHRPPDRRRGAVPRVGVPDPRRRPLGVPGRRGGPPPIPRDSRDHGGHGEAAVLSVRGHRDGRGAARAAVACGDRDLGPDRGRHGPRRGAARRVSSPAQS